MSLVHSEADGLSIPTEQTVKPACHSRCTCRSGRDFDGSEFSPCPQCEAADDAEREQAALIRDAARWRITQISRPRGSHVRGGFTHTVSDDHVFTAYIQPHPVTGEWGMNQCRLGQGKTLSEAIDGLFLSLDAYFEEGADFPAEIEGPRLLATSSRATGASQ